MHTSNLSQIFGRLGVRRLTSLVRPLQLLAGLVLTAVSAQAQDYIVQANGAGGAYTTVQAAIAAAVAAGPSGKIIEIRANTAGTTQVLAQTIDLSTVNIASTSEASWLTIRVRAGDTIRFKTTGILLKATGTSRGWKIEGNSSGYMSLQFGDLAEFNASSTDSFKTCYTHTNGAEISSTCSNYAIRRALFTGARGYEANHFRGSDFVLDTVAVFDHGSNTMASNPGNPDWGDAAVVSGVRAKLNKIYGRHGGHNTWVIDCRDSVVRDSDFSGYWQDIYPSDPNSGSRSLVLEPVDASTGGTAPWGPILLENSIIRDAGESGDNTRQAAMKTEGNRLILRDNFFFDTDSHLWQMDFTNAQQASTSYFSGNSYYHNTTYISKGTWWNAFYSYNTASGNAQFENNLIANNLFQQVSDSDKAASPANILWYDTSGTTLNGFPNGFHGTMIKGNVVGGPSAAKNVRLKTTGGVTALFPINAPASGYTGNVVGNLITNVTFSNVGTPRNRTKAGFAVTNWGSGAAGDAPALTTISANSSGTTITVANAKPFYSGWGIRGEVGDYLYIGSTAAAAESAGPVQISSINYTNNTIVLTASRSVTAGQGVWFGGNAANGAAAIRKNRGAFVAGGGTAPNAPTGLTATSPTSSTINLIWNDNSNNETGFEIDRATNSTFTTGPAPITNAYTTGSNPTMPFTAGGLSPSTTYYFRVRATNAIGDSDNYPLTGGISATTDSAGTPIVHDANALTIAASSGDGSALVAYTGASNNNFLRYNSNAIGDYITFNVNVPTANIPYAISVKYHENDWRGMVQLLIDGSNQGSAFDAHNETAQLTTAALGSKTFTTTGNHTFRFQITNKHANSQDFQIGIDTITLTP